MIMLEHTQRIMHANSKVYSQIDANLLALLGHDVLAVLPTIPAKLLHHRLLLVEPGALLLRARERELPDLDLIVEGELGRLLDGPLQLLVADKAPWAGLSEALVSKAAHSRVCGCGRT